MRADRGGFNDFRELYWLYLTWDRPGSRKHGAWSVDRGAWSMEHGAWEHGAPERSRAEQSQSTRDLG